jgi:hypothetical protein
MRDRLIQASGGDSDIMTPPDEGGLD